MDEALVQLSSAIAAIFGGLEDTVEELAAQAVRRRAVIQGRLDSSRRRAVVMALWYRAVSRTWKI